MVALVLLLVILILQALVLAQVAVQVLKQVVVQALKQARQVLRLEIGFTKMVCGDKLVAFLMKWESQLLFFLAKLLQGRDQKEMKGLKKSGMSLTQTAALMMEPIHKIQIWSLSLSLTKVLRMMKTKMKVFILGKIFLEML